MNYFLVDDDVTIRAMLTEMIEDEDLGEVVGEREDGSALDAHVLKTNKVDIRIIDLLMTKRDGLETLRQIQHDFTGKVVMISQVESKDLIGEAYSLGVEYYITKPLNRIEVTSILSKVNERIVLDQSIHTIQQSLNVISGQNTATATARTSVANKSLKEEGHSILVELGVIGEIGSRDLLEMIEYMDQDKGLEGKETMSLKGIYHQIAVSRAGDEAKHSVLQREVKASEQRVRRVVHQGLSYIASLGLNDFAHPVFDKYASTFFDYEQARKKMLKLDQGKDKNVNRVRIDTKKFIYMLYFEAKRKRME
ncbi:MULTISPECIES: response regulator [Pontibacillus]|uniref:Response regulator n=1 Tax=Pontibacillus chungwhensis TaxID=265426 RepID=A0ABY8UZM0_9BACI|nr:MULTISPECIES: response regulator [Pontibacillus]MCD5325988.1 response regulator [Pontibacillus sp. HN14]WIF98442.1 response regulator [Pontibacillus chungwhensis]